MTQIDLESPVAGPYVLGRIIEAALEEGDIDLAFACDLFTEICGQPVLPLPQGA